MDVDRKSRSVKFIICLLTLVLTLPTSAFALFSNGDDAPDFTAQSLKGETVRLSDHRGNPILLEMGTTWCPSCKEQAHQIDKIRDFLKGKGVTYISVFLADPVASIEGYLKDEKLAPPDQVLIDDGEARSNYLVLSIPRIILIDSQFRIIFDDMVLNADQLKTRIKQELH